MVSCTWISLLYIATTPVKCYKQPGTFFSKTLSLCMLLKFTIIKYRHKSELIKPVKVYLQCSLAGVITKLLFVLLHLSKNVLLHLNCLNEISIFRFGN